MVRVKEVKKYAMLTMVLAAIAGSQLVWAAPGKISEKLRSLESKVSALEADQGQVRQVRRQLRRLKQQVADMDQRLLAVEDALGDGGIPPSQPKTLIHACLITDSGFHKTFSSKGRSQLDAEIKAKKLCEKSVHSSYCSSTSTVVKCDTNKDLYPGESYICTLTDTGFRKTFVGEGSTKVLAEAATKQQCQSNVHASYCSKAQVRCDVIQN